MPVIVVGADSEVGIAIIWRLQMQAGEVRAFVSDRETAGALRGRGVKVAVGDVSDFSHVEGAARGAFCAVLVAAAPTHGRETAFANPRSVVEGCLRAVTGAGVTRVIVVGEAPPHGGAPAREIAAVPTVGRTTDEIAAEVAALDDAARL